VFIFCVAQDRIDGVRIANDQFMKAGHFDAENIRLKYEALNERYSSLIRPMILKKKRLLDSLAVQQLFRDVEDEEAWIREKEPIVASTNRGRDLIGVQVLESFQGPML
jgi:spectrin alpha